MKKIETNLEDCYILEPQRFGDERGYFESVTKEVLEDLGFNGIYQVSNAVFGDKFTMEENLNFINERAKSKFENGFVNDFFDRAEYIIFGIPSNFIEGVLVGRKYENDKVKLEKIKKVLPNAYICNFDGKVIF